MTESQWRKSKDGDAMLWLVNGRLSMRKRILLPMVCPGDFGMTTEERLSMRKWILLEGTDPEKLSNQELDVLLSSIRRNQLPGDPRKFAKLLREQVGNPFRPYRFEATWRTETVLALATAIEAGRAFDRMPILADALEEAGCDDEAILQHCRGTEPHARGCWVLDLILNREPELFAAPPLESRKRPQGRRQQLGPYTPPPEGMA